MVDGPGEPPTTMGYGPWPPGDILPGAALYRGEAAVGGDHAPVMKLERGEARKHRTSAISFGLRDSTQGTARRRGRQV